MEVEKSNWIVIHIYHERYFFSAATAFYQDSTIQEIIEENNLSIAKIKNSGPGFYMLDSTHRRNSECTDFEHIYPEVWLIIKIDELNYYNDSCEFIFGKTNLKYGLLDTINKDL